MVTHTNILHDAHYRNDSLPHPTRSVIEMAQCTDRDFIMFRVLSFLVGTSELSNEVHAWQA